MRTRVKCTDHALKRLTTAAIVVAVAAAAAFVASIVVVDVTSRADCQVAAGEDVPQGAAAESAAGAPEAAGNL